MISRCARDTATTAEPDRIYDRPSARPHMHYSSLVKTSGLVSAAGERRASGAAQLRCISENARVSLETDGHHGAP